MAVLVTYQYWKPGNEQKVTNKSVYHKKTDLYFYKEVINSKWMGNAKLWQWFSAQALSQRPGIDQGYVNPGGLRIIVVNSQKSEEFQF